MEEWISELMKHPGFPLDSGWEAKRRWMFMNRWPDSAVRAAEQDARMGNTESLNRYDSEIAAIKEAITKP